MAHLSVREDSTQIQEQKVKKKKEPKAKKTKKSGGIMAVLSKLSKAFLLPIALLPIAGVFLGVGAAIANQFDPQSVGWYIGTVMNKMGDVAFGNLPILFSMSVAMAYTKDAGVAALTAVVGFLVMNAMQGALITVDTQHIDFLLRYLDNGVEKTIIITAQTGSEAITKAAASVGIPESNFDVLSSTNIIDSYKLLVATGIPTGLITANLGITSLNTGVFAGIFVGAISAWTYNKFHKTQLPSAFSFFSGTKLVPIITFFLVLPLSFIFMFAWPWIGKGLAWFGTKSGELPAGVDSLVFEAVERSLVPFGLHHVFYAPLWWTNAGGSISDTLTSATNAWNNNELFRGLTVVEFMQQWISAHGDKGGTITADLNGWSALVNLIKGTDLYGATGDQIMMAKVIANLDLMNFTDLDKLGMNLGRFQSGKFGFMLLGLPAAGLAMWLNVPKENRKSVMGIYFSAAFTSFLTGITEPIEYTFLFLAPWLFYGVHMPLAALAFFGAGMLHTHVSMTVSGGFIDYIVFGIIPYIGGAMKPMSVFGVLIIAAISAPLYFFAFYFAVKYGKVMVPGRDTSTDASQAKLYTKDDYKAAHGQNRDGSPLEASANPYTTSSNPAEIAKYKKAEKIIEYLGGEQNIVDVDACASRLRLTVVDGSKVDKDGILSLGGATGALIKDTNVQVVYGGEQEAIKPRMNEILHVQRSPEFKQKIAIGANTSAPIASQQSLQDVINSLPSSIITCPHCGKEINLNELVDHKQKEVKQNNKKPITAKQKQAKSVVQKTTSKPTVEKEKESKEFLDNLQTKYAKTLKDKPVDKNKTKGLTSQQRAKLDGSNQIDELRQELQKMANQLREVAEEKELKLKKVNLREMTKKEIISYMQKIKNKIDQKDN